MATPTTDRIALTAAVDDALDRLARDDRERGGRTRVSTPELFDSVWGRLTIETRRRNPRDAIEEAMVQRVRRRLDGADHDGGRGVGRYDE